MPFFNIQLDQNNQFIFKALIFDAKKYDFEKMKHYLSNSTIEKLNKSSINCLFDTGANFCAINETLVEKYNLEKVGTANYLSASENTKGDVYHIHICIPINGSKNRSLNFISARVTSLPELAHDRNHEIIIGMDIIKNRIFQYTPGLLTIGF